MACQPAAIVDPPEAAAGKLVAFFLIKAALGLASAATEAWLYRWALRCVDAPCCTHVASATMQIFPRVSSCWLHSAGSV